MGIRPISMRSYAEAIALLFNAHEVPQILDVIIDEGETDNLNGTPESATCATGRGARTIPTPELNPIVSIFSQPRTGLRPAEYKSRPRDVKTFQRRTVKYSGRAVDGSHGSSTSVKFFCGVIYRVPTADYSTYAHHSCSRWWRKQSCAAGELSDRCIFHGTERARCTFGG